MNTIINRGRHQWLSRRGEQLELNLAEAESVGKAVDDAMAMGGTMGPAQARQGQVGMVKPVPALSPAEQEEKKHVFGDNLSKLGTAVQDSNENIDFKNSNPNYPSSTDTKEDIEANAIRTTLFARRLHQNRKGGSRGIGSKLLSYEDVQALRANERRNREGYGNGTPEMVERLVRASRPHNFNPKFIEATWNVVNNFFAKKSKGGMGNDPVTDDLHFGITGTDELPNRDRFKDDEGLPLMRRRDPVPGADVGPRGEKTKFREAGTTEEEFMEKLMNSSLGEGMRGSNTSRERGRLMWQILLQQGGRDALTGLPLDMENMALEHVRAFNNEKLENGTELEIASDKMDRAYDRDNDKNFVLINKGVNDFKNDNSMDDFYKRLRRDYYDLTQEDFDIVGDGVNEASDSQKAFSELISGTIFDKKGNLRPDVNPAEFLNEMMRYEEAVDQLEEKFDPKIAELLQMRNTSKSEANQLKPNGFGNINMKLDPEEFTPEQKDMFEGEDNEEFRDKLTQFLQSSHRHAWYDKRSKSVASLKELMGNEIVKHSKLGVTWRNPRSGDKMDRKMLTRFVRDMLNDPNISDPKREKQYRDLFAYAKDQVENIGENESRPLAMKKILEDMGYNPDNM